MVLTEEKKQKLLVCGWLNDAIGDLKDAQQSYLNAIDTKIILDGFLPDEQREKHDELYAGFQGIGDDIQRVLNLGYKVGCVISPD